MKPSTCSASANRIDRFQIHDVELAVTLAAGALFGLIQLLNERSERDESSAADRLAQDLLIVCGLSTQDAQEVCTRALPDLDDIAVSGRHRVTIRPCPCR
jgi:hypothetical protein